MSTPPPSFSAALTSPRRPHRGGVNARDVLADLGPLTRSADPGVVFDSLARLCVPAFADQCSLTLTEDHQRTSHIQYPTRAGAVAQRPATTNDTDVLGGDSDRPGRAVTEHTLSTPFAAASVAGFGAYSGVLNLRWSDGYQPSTADAGLARLMVEHAVAVIQRHRVAYLVEHHQLGALTVQALVTRRDHAMATGRMMATEHVSTQVAGDHSTPTGPLTMPQRLSPHTRPSSHSGPGAGAVIHGASAATRSSPCRPRLPARHIPPTPTSPV